MYVAFLKCCVYSASLCQWVDFNAIIPQRQNEDIKTLYLLHGLKFDYTSWSRYTNVERYAEDAGIAVIMPDAGRSFYTDMVNGRKYYTYVSKELVEITRNMFHLSKIREKTFIAGLSMGGYGAYKIAFLNPETFGKAASLSGAVDVTILNEKEWERENYLITGGLKDLKGSEYDLYYLAQELLKSGKPLPKLYQACGTSDFVYNSNVKFRDFIKDKGFDYKYYEGPGEHNWSFWEMHIKDVIEFMVRD